MRGRVAKVERLQDLLVVCGKRKKSARASQAVMLAFRDRGLEVAEIAKKLERNKHVLEAPDQ